MTGVWDLVFNDTILYLTNTIKSSAGWSLERMVLHTPRYRAVSTKLVGERIAWGNSG